MEQCRKTILVYPVREGLKIVINGISHEKSLTPRQMRDLAIRILQAAGEAE